MMGMRGLERKSRRMGWIFQLAFGGTSVNIPLANSAIQPMTRAIPCVIRLPLYSPFYISL